eukprot:gene24286-gene20065
MVRLVFRPYTQIRRSICTLESLRTSTRVSPGFVLFRHSSPSFGSQHVCSGCDSSYLIPNGTLLSFRAGDSIPNTRTHVRLLGPCFKTG